MSTQEQIPGNFFTKKLKKYLRPRIGRLYQYAPRPLHLPKRYEKKPLLRTPLSISIVTPSFNQGGFLERTILSILGQAYPFLEYIIQDGGSTDESLDIIQRHASSFNYWESQKDLGQSNALNRGFQRSTGDIMAYLNSDDLLLPGTLHYVARYFATHPNVDVVYGQRIMIDEQDQEIGRWILPPHDAKALTWIDYIPQETLFWRRRIWDKVGGHLDENFHFAMDWDLLLRFSQAGAKFVRLPRFLGAFRVHPQQKTATEMSEIGIKEIELLRMRCHGHTVLPIEMKKNIRFFLIKHILCHKLHEAGVLRY